MDDLSLNGSVGISYLRGGGTCTNCEEITVEALFENIVAGGVFENQVISIPVNGGRCTSTNVEFADGFVQAGEDQSTRFGAGLIDDSGAEVRVVSLKLSNVQLGLNCGEALVFILENVGHEIELSSGVPCVVGGAGARKES